MNHNSSRTLRTLIFAATLTLPFGLAAGSVAADPGPREPSPPKVQEPRSKADARLPPPDICVESGAVRAVLVALGILPDRCNPPDIP